MLYDSQSRLWLAIRADSGLDTFANGVWHSTCIQVSGQPEDGGPRFKRVLEGENHSLFEPLFEDLVMHLNSMDDLFLHEIRDLHSAERQLIKALPKMARSAHSKDLKDAFEAHLEQTKIHVNRLDRVLEMLGKTSRGPVCKAMEGLLEEGTELMETEGDLEVKDAALIGAAQRVEHYEISGYGTARTFAELVGQHEAAELLQQTLDEERATDERLTDLAMAKVNERAAR